jgi:hypothetical protein
VNHPDHEDKSSDQKGTKKKNWYETHTAALHKQSGSNNSPTKNFSITYNEEGGHQGESPGKMLEEQRKKVFYQKKAEMLANF